MANRLILFAIVSFFISVPIGSVQAMAGDLRRFEFEERHMGTIFRIVFYGRDKQDAITAVTAAFKRVRELEQVMSDYSSSSEIMKVCTRNDQKPGEPIAISDDLAKVLHYSFETSRLSDGAFDVTIGPVSQLWRTTRKTQKLPEPKVLQGARKKVGWQRVQLDETNKSIRLEQAGMRIDFGGIGKGFAADEALAVLKKLGYPQALVAAAGDITVGDPPPDQAGWTIDIEPLGPGKPMKTIRLANASVSTSGDLFQYVEIDGVRYSHVLDPKTGLGLTGFSRATVIAPKGYQADSLTKMISVLPAEEAKKRIEKLKGVEMYLVTKGTSQAEPQITESGNFSKYVIER